MKRLNATTLLGACIALALAASAAAQTTKPRRPADAPTQAQLDAAQADLERAAKRLAELQGRLGAQAAPDVHVFERHMVRKPVIGVVLAPDAQAGVRVAGVTPDSGAAKAGLKSGDRITAVGGTQVLGNTARLRLDNARKLFVGIDEGKPIRIDYVRAGKAASANVTASLDQDVFWVGGPDVDPQIRRIEVPGVGDDVRREVIRIGPRGQLQGQGLPGADARRGVPLERPEPRVGRRKARALLRHRQGRAGAQRGRGPRRPATGRRHPEDRRPRGELAARGDGSAAREGRQRDGPRRIHARSPRREHAREGAGDLAEVHHPAGAARAAARTEGAAVPPPPPPPPPRRSSTTTVR
jgi:hypothetical protein